MQSSATVGTPVGGVPLAHDQLGKIAVARILELAPSRFGRRVKALESTQAFTALWPAMERGTLSGAPVESSAARMPSGNVIANFHVSGRSVTWTYASPYFDRVYRFDQPILGRLIERGGQDYAALVGRLRLVNTRNRLTHCLLETLLHLQGDFLRTGDSLRLYPFTLEAVAASLHAPPGCPVAADPSRLSRLLRGATVRIPNGAVVPLRTLCPRHRDVYRLYVGDIVRQERASILADHLRTPLSDRAIAGVVAEQFGVALLPRTIAQIRQDLGVPSFRSPARKSPYIAATLKFSMLMPFSAQTVAQNVPAGPGVYEIRMAYDEPRSCPVIYLGSARDLRRRLLDHVRGYSNNPSLHRYIKEGACLRYRLVQDGNWRSAEREAYEAFCASFGEPPTCNRVSP